FTS
ncbi:hypothetical protein D047_5052B, partial [Vibrio parahaemolyticus VPTS-2010_2]